MAQVNNLTTDFSPNRLQSMPFALFTSFSSDVVPGKIIGKENIKM